MEELDDYKDIWAIHRRTVESHKPFRDFRYTFSGADGQTHHVSISGKPVFDESGGFTGYRGVGRDLTDAVELERAATQAHMRLIEAIDSLSLGFALFDQEDKLVLFNVRYRELCDTADEPIISMRIKFEDLLRKAISAGVLSDEMGAAEEQFENRMRLHQNLPSLHEQKIADGRWLEIHEFPAHDGGVVTVMEDITERKRYEDSLQDRERELSRSSRSRQTGYGSQTPTTSSPTSPSVLPKTMPNPRSPHRSAERAGISLERTPRPIRCGQPIVRTWTTIAPSGITFIRRRMPTTTRPGGPSAVTRYSTRPVPSLGIAVSLRIFP